MKWTKYILKLFLFTMTLKLGDCLKVKAAGVRRNEHVCRKLTKINNFREDFLVGSTWRTYYSWLVRLRSVCLDMKFKKPLNSTYKRYSRIMEEYLPGVAWREATLLGIDEKHNHEFLMFPKGSPGRYLAVPDITKGVHDPEDKDYILQGGIPILRFAFQILWDGKFLLRWDCNGGIGHLMARLGSVNHTEVLKMVQDINMSNGHFACY